MRDDDFKAYAGCSLMTIALMFLFGMCILTMFVGCDTTYSEGHRDGYVQKFSQKGYVVKSWEGELATAGYRSDSEGRVSNMWMFSADDPAVIKELEAVKPNEPVRLYYRQVFINKKIEHDTGYRVVKVERLPTEKQ